MKKTFVCCVMLIVVCFTLVACDVSNVDTSSVLVKQNALKTTDASSYNHTLINSVQEFCADLTKPAADLRNNMQNTAISPISVYFALAMVAECADGDTRDEIVQLLNTNYATLSENIATLCAAMNKTLTNRETGEIYSMLSTANSIWLDKNVNFNEGCLDRLATLYNTSTYQVDFANEIAQANKYIRAYVKEQTHGLIDKDFNLPSTTLISLINTLYLKDVWNTIGRDCDMTTQKISFIQGDGSTVNKIMLTDTQSRRQYAGSNFKSYYVTTTSGYKIYFLLPNDGISASDVMSKANILEALNAKYYGTDTQNGIEYITTCNFPEFKADFDDDLSGILKSLGMTVSFTSNADFSNISNNEQLKIASVQHVTDLTVNKKGVEGAAVTIVSFDATAPAPEDYTKVYETFELNRSFGFVLTDYSGIPLFSGIVNKI